MTLQGCYGLFIQHLQSTAAYGGFMDFAISLKPSTDIEPKGFIFFRKEVRNMCLMNQKPVVYAPCNRCPEFLNSCMPVVVGSYLWGNATSAIVSGAVIMRNVTPGMYRVIWILNHWNFMKERYSHE